MIAQSVVMTVGDVNVETGDGPHSLNFFARTLVDRLGGGDREYMLVLDTLKRSRHSTISDLMYRLEKNGMPEVSALVAHYEGLL